jgi:transcriptional regulator with XRE-family HTH domain
MDLDDLLGIDPSDPVDRRARALHDADRKLIEDLVARRTELGLSQQEVARRMDTGQSTVARIEAGSRDLRQSTIRRYAMAVEALIEHAVTPDDPRRAQSSAIIRDLGPQLTHAPSTWATFDQASTMTWQPPTRRTLAAKAVRKNRA